MQFIERLKQWRPVRALLHYAEQDGVAYAQSMTLSGFFSIFAGLFIAFAIFMRVLGGNAELRDAVIESVANQVPGLIDTGDGGVIDPQRLIESNLAAVAGIVAAVGILMTATRWIANSRLGFRAMLELPNPRQNAVLLKLGDLGVALGIGLLILTSAGVLVVSQTMAQAMGLGAFSWVLSIVIQLALDTATVLLMVRFAGRIRLPMKHLAGMAFAVAIAFAVLKAFASMLFGSISNNPLLASVASVFVILIWLGFIHQIYLIALSFVAVGSTAGTYSEVEQRLSEQREAAAAAKKKADELRESELQRVRDELDMTKSRRKNNKRLAKDLKKKPLQRS